LTASPKTTKTHSNAPVKMANFSSNDLEFLLPGASKKDKDDSGRAREIRSRIAQKDALAITNPLSKRKSQRTSKPLVYRPGKAPNRPSTHASVVGEVPPLTTAQQLVGRIPQPAAASTAASYEEAMVLNSSSSEESSSDDEDEILVAVPQQHISHVHQRRSRGNSNSSCSSDDDDADAEFLRRKQLKERILKKKQTQAHPAVLAPIDRVSRVSAPPPHHHPTTHTLPPTTSTAAAATPIPTAVQVVSRARAPSSSSESSSGSGSSYESDSDESGDDHLRNKPIFVPRSKRNAKLTEGEITNSRDGRLSSQLLNDTKRQQRETRREDDRIAETQQYLKRSSLNVQHVESTEELPDDTDGSDSHAELEAWRQREFLRIHNSESSSFGESTTSARKHMTDTQVNAMLAKQGRNVEMEVRKQRQQRQQDQRNSKMNSEVSGAKFLHRGAFGS